MATYTVKRGDNLLKISEKTGVSTADLLKANPNILEFNAGTVVNVPAARPSGVQLLGWSGPGGGGSPPDYRKWYPTPPPKRVPPPKKPAPPPPRYQPPGTRQVPYKPTPPPVRQQPAAPVRPTAAPAPRYSRRGTPGAPNVPPPVVRQPVQTPAQRVAREYAGYAPPARARFDQAPSPAPPQPTGLPALNYGLVQPLLRSFGALGRGLGRMTAPALPTLPGAAGRGAEWAAGVVAPIAGAAAGGVDWLRRNQRPGLYPAQTAAMRASGQLPALETAGTGAETGANIPPVGSAAYAAWERGIDISSVNAKGETVWGDDGRMYYRPYVWDEARGDFEPGHQYAWDLPTWKMVGQEILGNGRYPMAISDADRARLGWTAEDMIYSLGYKFNPDTGYWEIQEVVGAPEDTGAQSGYGGYPQGYGGYGGYGGGGGGFKYPEYNPAPAPRQYTGGLSTPAYEVRGALPDQVRYNPGRFGLVSWRI